MPPERHSVGCEPKPPSRSCGRQPTESALHRRAGSSREVMLWEIMRLLPEMLDQPEFGPLKHYLSDAADMRKRFQLSSQIANLFDQYLVFRPDLVLAWDEGRLSGCGLEGKSSTRLGRRRFGGGCTRGSRSRIWQRCWKEFGEQAAKPDFKPAGGAGAGFDLRHLGPAAVLPADLPRAGGAR